VIQVTGRRRNFNRSLPAYSHFTLPTARVPNSPCCAAAICSVPSPALPASAFPSARPVLPAAIPPQPSGATGRSPPEHAPPRSGSSWNSLCLAWLISTPKQESIFSNLAGESGARSRPVLQQFGLGQVGPCTEGSECRPCWRALRWACCLPWGVRRPLLNRPGPHRRLVAGGRLHGQVGGAGLQSERMLPASKNGTVIIPASDCPRELSTERIYSPSFASTVNVDVGGGSLRFPPC